MPTLKDEIYSLLKKNWMSSFQLQNAVKSSAADRIMRFLRAEGVKIKAKRITQKIGMRHVTYNLYKI